MGDGTSAAMAEIVAAMATASAVAAGIGVLHRGRAGGRALVSLVKAAWSAAKRDGGTLR
jgi:hypothetical protein